MIKAVVFDVDNTLVDFRKWKNAAVDAAIVAMIDAGLIDDEAEPIGRGEAQKSGR